MMSPTNDTELIRACREGSEGAFDALLQRYQKPVFSVAFRMVNDYEDAKDVTQIVFLKAYENLANYNSRYKFHSWIYRIAVNESINLLKKKSRLEPLEGGRPSEDRGPEELCAGREISRYVQEALMTMKPDHRVVIVLRHFLGCSYHDMGEILQLPEKTVKSRLFTARQRMRETLVNQGIGR